MPLDSTLTTPGSIWLILSQEHISLSSKEQNEDLKVLKDIAPAPALRWNSLLGCWRQKSSRRFLQRSVASVSKFRAVLPAEAESLCKRQEEALAAKVLFSPDSSEI